MRGLTLACCVTLLTVGAEDCTIDCLTKCFEVTANILPDSNVELFKACGESCLEKCRDEQCGSRRRLQDEQFDLTKGSCLTSQVVSVTEDVSDLGDRVTALEATVRLLTEPGNDNAEDNGDGPPGECTPVNVALRKPASQSSLYGEEHRGPNNPVDGNKDNTAQKYPQHHTDIDKDAWWSVDLQGRFYVKEIVVMNRYTHSERLVPYDVYLCSGEPCLRANIASGEVTAVHQEHFTENRQVYTMSDLDASGVTHVTVQLDKTDYLHLVEVDVIGCAM